MNIGMAAVVQQDQRRAVIEEWLDQTLGAGQWTMEAASADASFRRYFRVLAYGQGGMPRQWIVMDAPPDKEGTQAWLDICERLLKTGLHAPRVQAKDIALGLILMEDLGDRWLLQSLQQVQSNEASVNHLYGLCKDTIKSYHKFLHTLPSHDVSILPLLKKISLYFHKLGNII